MVTSMESLEPVLVEERLLGISLEVVEMGFFGKVEISCEQGMESICS